MAPRTNKRLLYTSHPLSFPVPGETFVVDASQTIDPDSVPLRVGEFLLKTFVVGSDPYLRDRMRPADVPSWTPPFTIGEPCVLPPVRESALILSPLHSVGNFGLGVVVRSNSSAYAVGEHIFGIIGELMFCFVSPAALRSGRDFVEYSILADDGIMAHSWVKLQKMPGLSWNRYCGALGMAGRSSCRISRLVN